MKRREFLKSMSAIMGGAFLRPNLAFANAGAPHALVSAHQPSSFMQAHALSVLRQNGSLSHSEFLAKTGLTNNYAESILTHFVQSGQIEISAIEGGKLSALRPEWMKKGQSLIKFSNQTQNLIKARAQHHQTRPIPQFESITNCCEFEHEDDIDHSSQISNHKAV